jgi:hypothetical protein
MDLLYGMFLAEVWAGTFTSDKKMTNDVLMISPGATDIAPETPVDTSNPLRSTALECLHAAEKSKHRVIRIELRELAKTYMDRALSTEMAAVKPG